MTAHSPNVCQGMHGKASRPSGGGDPQMMYKSNGLGQRGLESPRLVVLHPAGCALCHKCSHAGLNRGPYGY